MSKDSSNFAIEGFIDIEIINKKNNTRRIYKKHNTLTKAGAQMFLARSAGNLLKMAGDSFGQTYCYDSWTTRRLNMRISQDELNPITNVLANIDPEVASNMNSSSTFADIYSDNFDSTDKVIGYADINLQPADDGKQGVVDYSKGEYVADPYTRAMRWYYKPGVASGTFNAICMMGKVNAISPIPKDSGCIFGKILDKVNRCYANWGGNSNALCPPGVPGFTDNDTILINFTQDGKSRWKYSISTGEITEVPDSEPFISLGEASGRRLVDYFIEGDYLYTLNLKNKDSASPEMSVWSFNLKTQAWTREAVFDNYLGYSTGCHFLRYNNKVYVTWNCNSSNISYSTNNNRAFRLNGNSTHYSGYTNIANIATELGITIPSGIDNKLLSLGNYGVNYLVQIDNILFVVSDLNNMHGSMIEIIGNMHQGELPVIIPFSAGSNLGWLSLGCPGAQNNSGPSTIYNYNTDANWFTKMNTPTTEYASDFTTSGVCLMMDGWWTTLLSFAILDTPITKSDTDEMYVSYGYKVVV